MSEREATRRIEAGVAWFREHGWPLAGFVAPAWLLGPGAWQALATQRFEYTATLRELVHLPGRGSVKSQSVVYSTSNAWRRQSSLLWNATVARLERGNRVLRLELHPRDADFADVRRSWQKVLARALHDRRAVTVADFMRHDRAAAPTLVPDGIGRADDAVAVDERRLRRYSRLKLIAAVVRPIRPPTITSLG